MSERDKLKVFRINPKDLNLSEMRITSKLRQARAKENN